MAGINHKYNIELEILTPLSIGAGAEKDWVRGVDFVIDNHKLYKLNLKKMIQVGVSAEELSNLFSSKNEDGLKSRLAGMLNVVSDLIIPCPVESDNDVKAFVKNQMTGNPILAGSSLKGAVRSVLFDYLGGTSKDGKEVFGSSTTGDEFMRFIKFSDAEFDETSLINTKIFNLQRNGAWQGGWKHGQNETSSNYKTTGFNTLYECLMPEQKGYSSLMLSETTYDLFEKKSNKQHLRGNEKRHVVSNDIKKLFKIINNHTSEYLRKEKIFFKKYSTDKTDRVIDSINALLNSIPVDNSYCVLKMSAGAGFHSITGDWQFDDYTKGMLDRKRAEKKDLSIAGKILPKSRKIAIWGESFSLMGFVKLRVLSEIELRQIENQKAQAAAERIAVICQKQEESERAKAELEAQLEREREEAERIRREAEEKQQKYSLLIMETEKLYNEEKFEDALSKAQEAAGLLPKNKEHEYWISQSQYKVEQIKAELKAKETAKQEAMDRKLANSVPLSEKIANASKIPTLCGNVKTWLKYNTLTDVDRGAFKQKISDIYMTMKPKEQKDFQNFARWKDVVSLVGEDMAKQWHSDLF